LGLAVPLYSAIASAMEWVFADSVITGFIVLFPSVIIEILTF